MRVKWTTRWFRKEKKEIVSERISCHRRFQLRLANLLPSPTKNWHEPREPKNTGWNQIFEYHLSPRDKDRLHQYLYEQAKKSLSTTLPP